MAARIMQPAVRGKLAGLCLALLLGASLPTAGWGAAPSDPQQFVQSFYGVLLSNMKDGRMLGENGRYARLAP